ncbi:hypothetical protein Cgig2_020206 [Carnegiea gigantea]|uniref:Uncharacterized protein n=1 Tax=Carnegiea gigantea TaxID=171969 RepID=A0A9Q1QQM4_9CARY|nr:hypothetical protein Cgig2_020206 [Carnegiea gigantea]
MKFMYVWKHDDVANGATKASESMENEAAPISDSSSASDEEGSTFEEVDKGTDNSASSLSLSLEAEVSGSSGDVDMTELRSKHAHDKDVSISSCKEVKEERCCTRDKNVVEEREARKRKRNKGQSGANEGMVVENEGEGIGDVIVRHQCTLEAVYSLKSKLEECQKSAIERIVWSPILKYKPFVMDRHLVHALVESRVPESKAFRIGQGEVPFSVYDVTLLTGLPVTGQHVTFDQGEGPCEVEDMVKEVIDDLISRERVR